VAPQPAAAPEKPAAAKEPAAAAKPAPAAKGLVELTLHTYGDPGEVVKRHENMVKAFSEAFPGRYTYKPVITPFGEYIQKVVASIAAGVASDVFNMWAQYKPEWVEKGFVLDLTDRIKASKGASPANFFKAMQDSMQYKGKFWGTAQDYNATILIVNTDLFKNAGVNVPPDSWTMDDFRQLAKRLTDESKKVFGSTNWINQAGLINFATIWNYGKHFWVNEDWSKSLVNSEASVAAHRFFQEMAFADRSVPSPKSPMGEKQGPHQGYFAIWNSWGNGAWWIYTDNQGKIPFEWEYHTFPKGPRDQKHFAHGHLWSIPSNHKSPDDAWVLAEWIGGIEGWRQWVKVGKGQPLPVPERALWEQYYDFLPKEKAAKLIDFMVTKLYGELAFDFQYWPTYGECQKVMQEALTAMYGEKQADVKQTLDDTAKRMDAILAEYKKR